MLCSDLHPYCIVLNIVQWFPWLLYSVECWVSVSEPLTLYTVHCTLYTVHFTLYSLQCCVSVSEPLTDTILACRSLSSQRSWPSHTHCTLHTVHCTLCTLLCVHCTLYTVHCTLCTLFFVHCTLYTVHCTLYTVHSAIRWTSPGLFKSEPSNLVCKWLESVVNTDLGPPVRIL